MEHSTNNGVKLDEIIYSAQMGRAAVDMMREKTQDPALLASLERQMAAYQKIEGEARQEKETLLS